jgi:alkane 1-monooxygenase
MRILPYLFVYTAPAFVFLSLYLGGWWSFWALGYAFGLIPVLELILPAKTTNLSPEAEQAALENPLYDWLIWSLVPIQLALLGYFLYRISTPGLDIVSIVGMTVAYGISAGTLGINAAHELGHRNTKHEQFMSKILLATSLYMHFFIEHNRGHHKNVSTPEDPASSRYGEPIYAFYIRTITAGWLSAWKIEAKRLKQQGHGFWTLHNEMLVYQIVQLALLAGIAWGFGWLVMLYFVAGASIGFMLLETVNYIEHYGLQRQRTENDFYEKVQPFHSWNSNHTMGRLLLLELSRHSDHHYNASRKFQVLRHFDHSPQMPTGYPGMMLLALVPPLWFRVMHKQIEVMRAES